MTETTAAIQKAKIKAFIPADMPSSQPRPRTSLASPKPIHLPLDTTQSRANGNARMGPANSIESDGICHHAEPPMNMLTNASPSKV